MSHPFNQNWGVEEMVAFNGNVIHETMQHCGWTYHGVVCDMEVKTRDFNAHLRVHHGINSDAVNHRCCWHGCATNPMTRAGLERHVKERHIDVVWACPMCPMTFTRKNTLTIHLNERCPGTGH